ncbi:hypothetical protein M404DRAFT_992509 [Pisolithus tinctorius Marx 270]|uniref:Uncharacterized protein n=1 Tax=Pisolithus tinctorius Marx 270 TaxID=870435 RepID=A0A0C3PYH0_PISTI|nr:hypothetical protein M404DRAFT_992509 [Pisolithus tinctorius Marx 270]
MAQRNGNKVGCPSGAHGVRCKVRASEQCLELGSDIQSYEPADDYYSRHWLEG